MTLSKLPDSYAFIPSATPPQPTIIAPHSKIFARFYNLEATDLAAIQRREKHFYIWGIARYRDVYPGTEGRITKYCVFARTVTGDPLKHWNADTNRVEIVFGFYHRHNCADEDCNENS
jgi:hypothetical protein